MNLFDKFMDRVSQVKESITAGFSKKPNKELEELARKMLELSQQGLLHSDGNTGMQMVFEQIAGEARKVLGEEAPKHLTSPEEKTEEKPEEKTVEVATQTGDFKEVDAEEAEYEEVIDDNEEEPMAESIVKEEKPEESGKEAEKADEPEQTIEEKNSEEPAAEEEIATKETDEKVSAAEKPAEENIFERGAFEEKPAVSEEIKPEETAEQPEPIENEGPAEKIEEKVIVEDDVTIVELASGKPSVQTEIKEIILDENPSDEEPTIVIQPEPKKEMSKTEWLNAIVTGVKEKENSIEAIADAVASAVREAIAGQFRSAEKKAETVEEDGETGFPNGRLFQPIEEAEETGSITETAEQLIEEKRQETENSSAASEKEKDEIAFTAAEEDKDEETAKEEQPINDSETASMPDPVQELAEAAESEPIPEPEPQVEIDPTAFIGKKIIYACTQKGGTPMITECLKDWQIDYVETNNGLKTVETFSGSEAGTFDGAIFEKSLFLMDAVTVTKCIRKLKHPDSGVPVGVIAVGSAVSESLFDQAGITAWITDNTPEALYVMLQKMFLTEETDTENE